jgi:ribonuclease BN (tRNA processing enzyme)
MDHAAKRKRALAKQTQTTALQDKRMQLQFVGSGDAFGSGGRFHTCFHVTGGAGAGAANFLIDCGASSLIAMKRLGIDSNAIDLILLSHFHADHCGGVPFFMLDAQFVAKRTRPLAIAGPAPLEASFHRLMDAAYAGSSRWERKFELSLVELAPQTAWRFNTIEVLPALVRHSEANACYGYRIALDAKVVAYSGDTEWTDSLIGLARDADLFVSEACTYDQPLPMHLAYRQLVENLSELRPRRLIITHMGDDMLARRGAIAHETAEDGLIVKI